MIGKLATLTASQRAAFQSFAASRAETTNVLPQDAVTVAQLEKHRDPGEAIEFMERFDKQLGLSPEFTAEKHSLMAESSHAFFRASPALFYHDLKTNYAKASQLLPQPAPTVAIVGDCHALNAGTYRGPDGKAVWGLNDFDQSEMGSPEWDLERLGVSLYVASRSDGKSSEEALALVDKMAHSYLKALGKNGPAYLTSEEAPAVIGDLIKKAGSRSHEHFMKKWTTEDGAHLVRDDKLVDPDPERGRQIEDALKAKFPFYSFLDTAAKPHSGGSTRGLERYYSLVRSPGRSEPWLLETKAVLPSPVQIPDGDLSRGDGDKVIDFARRLGGVVDDRQRALKLGNTAFFTREREVEKDSLGEKQHELEATAEALGQLLARAHGRSGADLKGWVNGQEKTLVENLETFSRSYARQVESDFREWQSRYGKSEATSHEEAKKK